MLSRITAILSITCAIWLIFKSAPILFNELFSPIFFLHNYLIDTDNLFYKYQTFLTGIIALVVGGLTYRAAIMQVVAQKEIHISNIQHEEKKVLKTIQHEVIEYMYLISVVVDTFENLEYEDEILRYTARLCLPKYPPKTLYDPILFSGLSEENLSHLHKLKKKLLPVVTMNNSLLQDHPSIDKSRFLKMKLELDEARPQCLEILNSLVS